MKKIIPLLIPILFLTACFNYRDVNRVIFVTSLGVDIDENNRPVLYAEAFRSVRSAEAAGHESRLILNGSGDTIFEAIRNINMASAFKLNYTQNKAVIFSEKAAKYGIDHFIDVLFKDQELLTRQYIYVSKIDLRELMEMKLKDEAYLGIYLFDLTQSNPQQIRRPYMRIDEFYVERRLGSKINGLNTISQPTDSFIDRIILGGLAVMDEDMMIAELDSAETFIYSMVKDNLRSGYITVPNPDASGNLITLEILRSDAKTAVDYNGGHTVDVEKEINIRTTIAEVQEFFIASEQREKKMLQKSAEEKLTKDIMTLYEKFKEENIDIFDLERAIDIKYPNANINRDNIFDSMNLKVKVKVHVEGSSDVLNFY